MTTQRKLIALHLPSPEQKIQTLEVIISYSKYYEFPQSTKEQNLSKQGCMLLWLQNIEGVDGTAELFLFHVYRQITCVTGELDKAA